MRNYPTFNRVKGGVTNYPKINSMEGGMIKSTTFNGLKGGMRRKGRGKKRKEYRVYWWSAFDTKISARTAIFPACQFILRVAIYPAQFLQRWRLGTFALCLAIKHFLIAHKCYQDFTEFYGPIWPKKCEKLRLCALKFPQANYKKRTTLCIAHCNLFCMHEVLLRKYYTKLHYIIL